MTAEKKLLSIIVPVYNTEKYLRHCLDTLVMQTCLAGVEVIVVNDESPDQSDQIILEYAQRYPDVVRFYRILNSGLSGAREYGLTHAYGEYVYFVDSDDYVDYTLCQRMIDVINTTHPDLIYTPIVRVPLRGPATTYNVITGPANIDTIFRQAACSYYSCAYRREFMLQFCPLPRMWYEDMGSTRTIVSYAKTFGYVKGPAYYYVEHEGTITTSIRDPRTLDTINAVNKIIDECNPTYIDQVAQKAAQRILIDLTVRWIWADEIIANAKTRMRYFKNNPVLMKYPQQYQGILRIKDLPEHPAPCNLLIGGFGKESLTEQQIEALRQTAYTNGGTVKILNESCCDVTVHPSCVKALECENYEYLNVFFACRAICEEGGIYIAPNMRIDAPLNSLRYFESFFSFESKQTISASIFGGIKNSQIMRALLESFDFYSDEEISVQDRIKNVLVAAGNIRMDGNTQHTKKTIVFSPNVFVVPAKCGYSLSHYAQFEADPGCFMILQDVMDLKECEPSPFEEFKKIDEPEAWLTQNKAKATSISKQSEVIATSTSKQSEAEIYKSMVEEIYNSTSWKVTKPFRIISGLLKSKKHNK